MAKQNLKQGSKQTTKPKKTKKRKRFSIPDFIAAAIFALIIAVVIGSVGYYYGIHRPQAGRTVTERAVTFSELFFNFDYRDEDFSFEPILPLLTSRRARIMALESERVINNRQATQLRSEVLETEVEVTNLTWDRATVLVRIKYKEDSLTQDSEITDGIISFTFQKVGNDWLIDRYGLERINE